jgi:enamine deaminase RidA (YjgF/YER057c/UK114 family)
MIRKLLFIVLIISANTALAQLTPEEKIKQLGIILPELAVLNSNSYVNAVRSGNLIYLSGKGPLQPDGKYVTGKAGKEISADKAAEASRWCAIHQLAVLKLELGSLSKVKRIIKVNGFVNSSPDFYDQPKVIDGFSNLLIEVFGDKGKHSRTAVGVASLPFNWTVEADLIVEIEQ